MTQSPYNKIEIMAAPGRFNGVKAEFFNNPPIAPAKATPRF